MKQAILFLISIFAAQAAVAQNWQPIYLNETLNYQSSANPDEPIGVFASDLSENGDSTLVRITLNTDTLDECDCEFNCYRLKADFLQSSLAYLPDGVIAFHNPDTFYIHTQANFGDSWIFQNDSAGNDITATVISVSLTEILGETDSLKIISLSNEEEIQLSKNHGISKWISANDTLTLISIPSRDLGEQPYLTKAEVYDFNVGDVFCYAVNDSYKDYGDGVNYTFEEFKTIYRIEVIGVTQNDSVLQLELLRDIAYDGYLEYGTGYPNNAQGYYHDTVVSEISLFPVETMYELPDNRYWYKGAELNMEEDYWSGFFPWLNYGTAGYFTGSPQYFSFETAFRMNNKMLDDRKILSYGMNNFSFEFTDQTTISEVLEADIDLDSNIDVVSYCNPFEQNYLLPGDVIINPMGDWSPETRTGIKLSAEGLGVVAFYGQLMYSIEIIMTYKTVMIGYKKGEETYGFVPEVIDLVSVGTTDLSAPINFSVFPNPASSSIQVVWPSSESGKLEILDISGRELFTMPIHSEKVEIETGQYPAGVYLIRVETQNGVGVKKMVVSR